jgi:5-methylcytosine-specific restriction endonuclease McrA
MEFKVKSDRRAYRRDHYLKNRDKAKAQRRALYLKKREFILNQSAQYNSSHPCVVKRSQKRYREKNKESDSRRHRDYRNANLELIRRRERNHPNKVANSQRRRAIKKLSIINQAFITQWMATVKSRAFCRCYYCRCRLKSSNAHFDHIVPLSRGGPHCVENLCVSCSRCNLSKGVKPVRLWIQSGQQLLEV